MSRFIGIGSLVGIIAGIIASLLFPELLVLGFDFNQEFYLQIGLPFNEVRGSATNIVFVVPVFMGIIGGIAGIVLYKVIKK